MRALEPVVDDLLAIWRPDGADRGRDPGHEQARAVDPRVTATSATSTPTPAARCSCRCGTTRATRAAPTPTTCTSSVEIDPDGVYQITGLPRARPGSWRSPQQRRRHGMFSPNQVRTGRPVNATNDLDDLTIGDDGSFSVILSVERPDGLRGRLVGARPEGAEPADAALLVRLDQRGRRARRDRAPRRRGADMTPEEIAARFSDMAAVDRGDDRASTWTSCAGTGSTTASTCFCGPEDRHHGRCCRSRRTTTASTRSTTTRR